MHRYDELEKLYYKKKITKIILNFFLVLVVVFLSYFSYHFIYDKKKETSSVKQNIKHTIKNQNFYVKTPDKNLSKKVKKTIIKKNKKDYNTPVLSFIISDINTTAQAKNVSQKKIIKKKISKKVKKNKILKGNNIPSIEIETIDIKQLINNYKKNQNFDTAIVIAKYYLNKNQLKNSKLWALKANSIDPKRYESWKIFALILLKKHKNKKAKEVLQTYLNDYGYNNEINKLLRSINE